MAAIARLLNWRWALPGLLVLTACAPPAATLPAPVLLETSPPTAVPTAVLPTPTMLVLTRPPLLPTATRVIPTPTPSPTPTPPTLVIESVSSSQEAVLVPLHANCVPQTTHIRAVVRSVAPVEAVWVTWFYQGSLSSRPGIAMSQVARVEWAADLGPFPHSGRVNYWVVARASDGSQAISETGSFEVRGCGEPSPLPPPTGGPRPTNTPYYGEALSVHAVDQTVDVPHNTPVTLMLRWEGGVGPYTVDRVTQPGHGTLSGIGLARTYTPDPGYSGPDRFTFRVLDSAGQASTGTITLRVLPP